MKKRMKPVSEVIRSWKTYCHRTGLLVLFFILPFLSLAQNAESTKSVLTFKGGATFTTKGLSTFPNLTLGKPAAIFDFSVGGDKFRFEPTLRFALDGKPWTFIFWFRYELLKTERFQLKLGAHPAYSFKTITVNNSGTESEIVRVQQYIAGELAPFFLITKNFNAGPYYLYANGITDGAVKNSHFLSLRTNFSNLQLNENYFMRLMAQAYYLKMDENDGFYVNATLSINRGNFPLSISSTVNKALDTTIPGDDFLWNINLTWSFGGNYRKI